MPDQHTPTPWYYAPAMQTGLTRPYEKFDIYHVTPPDRNNSYGVDTGSRKVFLGMIRSRPSKSETEANAAFIVRAVNSHDALVEALEGLRSWAAEAQKRLPVETWADLESHGTVQILDATAALALAKGE